MYEMRYSNRECNDTIKINQFLAQAHVGHLGLAVENTPYVVPLNFVWYKDKIYFHGASSGRKAEMLEQNPNVCFTVAEEHGIMPHPVPAKTDTAYMSVMLFGCADVVDDLNEATQALQSMLDKYAPGYYQNSLAKGHVEKYESSKGSKVRLYRITPSVITAKENPLA